jgi:hypothetical protein
MARCKDQAYGDRCLSTYVGRVERSPRIAWVAPMYIGRSSTPGFDLASIQPLYRVPGYFAGPRPSFPAVGWACKPTFAASSGRSLRIIRVCTVQRGPQLEPAKSRWHCWEATMQLWCRSPKAESERVRGTTVMAKARGFDHRIAGSQLIRRIPSGCYERAMSSVRPSGEQTSHAASPRKEPPDQRCVTRAMIYKSTLEESEI